MKNWLKTILRSPEGETGGGGDTGGAVEDVLGGAADQAPADETKTETEVKEGEDKTEAKEGEAKEGEDKTEAKEDEADPLDAVPEGDYAFELPEGMEIDEAMAAAAQPVFKELGLTSKAANRLAQLVAETRQAEADAIVDNYVKGQQAYVAAAKADKEIGGENWTKSTAAANQALQKFGTPALTAALREHGMQNHPELIRALARVGQHTADDTVDTGDAVDTTEVPPEARWYGSTTKTTRG